MKKRSLVAAVAMLLVSALVLTSATFAWFAQSNSATVGAINAKCVNTDGALLVCADADVDANYKTEIKWSDFSGKTGYETGDTPAYNMLNPVDMKFAADHTGNFTAFDCTYDGTKFTTPVAASSSDYQSYTFFVKNVGADAVVDLDPSWSGNGTTPFIFGAIKCSEFATPSQWYIFGNSSYNCFQNNSWTTVTEGSTPDGIIGSDDTGYATAINVGGASGSPVTIQPDTIPAKTNASYPFKFTAQTDDPIQVDVIIWAEGQESSCTGAASASVAGFSFTPAIVTT